MEQHLQGLIGYFSTHPALALGAVFAAALLEALAVIGTVVPGSSIVFVGGMLVGLQALNLQWTAAAAVGGAILGDGISYWLGRHHHERIRSMWPLRSHPEILRRGEAYFARHGGKSVFLGRFLGPVRAIVPVVAGMTGMPAPQFYVVNVLSAFAWVAAHMLPGVLFGASLQLASAVSSRLVVLLALVVGILWALGWALRLAHRHGMPVLRRQRDRLVGWAGGRPGNPGARILLSLLDPARPEAPAMLAGTVLLLGAGWLFLGILEDIASNAPLVQFDQAMFSATGGINAPWATRLMVAVTELGSASVSAAVVAAVAVLLAMRRCWRTLVYWLGAIGFAQALVWVIKSVLERKRPTALDQGFEQFSFPSGHAASAFVIYGFLSFLVARGHSGRIRSSVAVAGAAWIVLIAVSRLYLGVHWISDVVAGLALGTAWVALVSIGYTHHVVGERVPSRLLAIVALGALAFSGSFYLSKYHAADMARFAPGDRSAVAPLADWRGNGWQTLAAHRSEIGGEPQEPLTVQWAGAPHQIAQSLSAGGWRAPAPWTSSAALLWLLPASAAGELPVLPKLNHGAPQRLEFEQVRGRETRLVLRLWPTGFVVDMPSGDRSMLWHGMVTLERLEHPGGILTVAVTDSDFLGPVQELAALARSVSLQAQLRQAGPRVSLLIW